MFQPRFFPPVVGAPVVLAALVHLLVSPPASNMVSRATYLVSGPPPGTDTVDEGVEPLGLRRPDEHDIEE